MKMFLEAALALLSVVGLLSVGWLCFGKLLVPAGNRNTLILLPGIGDGDDLEQAVTGWLWLRGSGLTDGRILIVDCGLSPQGMATAMTLCAREQDVGLCIRDEVNEYLNIT